MRFLALLLFPALLKAAPLRQNIDFSENWSFKLGDSPKAKSSDFDSSSWKVLKVPHDWAHQNGISKDGAQTDKGGYYSGGIGWYRKTFTAPPLTKDQELHLNFDGVYMNSEVFLNGTSLGTFPYGYLSFSHELTPHLRAGKNIIAVRVDNSKEPSARWYHPCGIYAPVTLQVLPTARISDVFVTTPKVTAESATISVKATIPPNTRITHQILAPDNTPLTDTLQVSNPQLWSPETPSLYTLVTRLHQDDKVIDEVTTRIGIRTIKWDPATGFHLNGKVTKLLGVCEHWEGGPVGGAWTPGLMRWKLQLLKNMGCNSIRTSHNPFPPFFYDLCDELGILVMDEIFDGWIKKAPQDYGARFFKEHWKKDLTSWIIRDRNHPSIIIYSVGNETRGPIASELVKTIHELDPTRPVTSGHSGSEHMDVYGVNGSSEKQNFYTKYPRPKNKAFIATEAPHTWQVRGYYRTRSWFRDGFPNKRQDPFPLPDLTEKEIFTYDWTSPAGRKNRKQIFNSSYDNAMVRITARKNWEILRDTPWYAGHFRWTGFDYPGEAGYVHGGWPFRAFMGGPLDLAGLKKDLYYFYQSQWTTEPMVHLLPHWTHPKMESGTGIPVWAYSNADEVELFLNGKSLGIDRPGTKAEEMQCSWLVPWQPGTLLAIARTGDKEVSRASHTTAGQPTALRLTKDLTRKNPIITTTLVDKNDIPTPYADNRIHYHLEGNLQHLVHENGNPVDTENGVTSSSCRAFMGLTRAFFTCDDPHKFSSLTAAAILGSRNGVTGDPLVSIDCKTIITGALFGQKPHQNLTIHYTIDGSTPTTKSPLYKLPFSVSLPTTVKALILSKGKTLFSIEEQFGKDQGLYWSDGTEAPIKDHFLQAESAKLSKGAKKKKTFVDLPNKGASLTFPLGNNGIAGKVNLHIDYAQKDPTGQRKLLLKMNGKTIRVLKFSNTGSWSKDWKRLSTTIYLQAGANELTLVAQDRGGPTIDRILIKD